MPRLSRPRAAISWSGGSDGLAALSACRARFDVVAALTMFDEGGARSRSHGLRPELIAAEAGRPGLRAVTAIAVTRGETVRRECFALDLVPGHLRRGFGAQDAAGG